MAPDSPITQRPSMKRKLSDRDEILQKWRTDRNFKADGDYRDKCQTIYADAEEVIIENSHQSSHSKISGNNVNKKFKKSSCANDALKLVIQECIGRIDKIDRDFEKYRKSSSFEKTSVIFPIEEEKSCGKCICFPKEKSSKTKEHLENNVTAAESGEGKIETVSSHSEIIEGPSENFSVTDSAALPNVVSQMSLVESTEMLPRKLLDTCQTSVSTVSTPENASNKPTQTIESERIVTSPTKDDSSCKTPASKDDLSCNTPASKDDLSYNTPATKDDLPCNTPATKNDLSCNTPATNKIKTDTRSKSKSKEIWFEASIHNFENNSPNVQRGRPSIHILKDRRAVQSLAKQFS